MPETGTSAGGRQFHLKQLVGKGAFGEVYLAEQDSGAGFRRKVAIKLLHADVAAMSRDAGRRMRDEARILGRLSHRNIVTVLDLIKLGDRWAIIMDYVPGADLEEVLYALEAAEETFPAPAAIECGAAVLNALHAAFEADDGEGGTLGVIHRDIKPANVRLTNDGEVKVLDFGVARMNMDTREAMTRASGWIGTERYMAPERILIEGDGPEGDVYAAAATVVELLLRRPLGRTPVREETHGPFVEEALTECRGVLNGSDEVVDEVIEWLRKGLHALPTERPSAREMSDALGRLARQLDGEGVLEFTRRFMPKVDDLLDRHPQPVKGTLSEHTSGPMDTESAGGPTMGGARQTTGNETMAPGLFDADDGLEEPTSTSRSTVLIGGGVAVALAALVTGSLGLGAVFMAFNRPTPPPTSPEPTLSAEPSPAPAPAPTPPPAPEPEPEPAEEPSPAPAPAPRPAPTPRPAPAPEPAPVASGPPVTRALVVLDNAQSVKITCGTVSATGTASARIADFPSGSCKVDVVYLGSAYSTSVTIERPREVHCEVDGDSLSCT